MKDANTEQLTGKIPAKLMAKIDAKRGAASRSALVRLWAEQYAAGATDAAPAGPAGDLLKLIKDELAVVAVFVLSAQAKRLTSTADAVAAVRAAYLSGALAAEVFPEPAAAAAGSGGAP